MRVSDRGVLSGGTAGTDRAVLCFPGVLSLSNGVLLATYRAGSTKSSDDETVELCRSTDGGRSWSGPRRCFEAPLIEGHRGSLKVVYLSESETGHLLAAAMWVDRDAYPGQPLFNPETEGCLPMRILMADSSDLGETWSAWREVPMPDDIGPPSLTSPILALPDGTLGMSIETNKHYHDIGKWYQRVVLFRSVDGGQTWGPPIDVGHDPTGRIYNWDQRVGVAPDGRMAAFVWTYDSESLAYLNVHRRISTDGGQTWSAPEDLGFTDQPSRPAILPDGRVVLAWVDRFHSQSIRARQAAGVDAPFDPSTEVEVYAHGSGKAKDGSDDTTGELLADMSIWSFGLPFAEVLPNGEVLVAYYAGTEAVMDIHWCRLRVVE